MTMHVSRNVLKQASAALSDTRCVAPRPGWTQLKHNRDLPSLDNAMMH
jgi:hypothetical protein